MPSPMLCLFTCCVLTTALARLVLLGTRKPGPGSALMLAEMLAEEGTLVCSHAELCRVTCRLSAAHSQEPALAVP